MEVYASALKIALLVFPIVAAMLTIPYMLVCYHRYGAVSKLRSLIVFSFIFYLLCAYCLVIFPLPDPATLAERTDNMTQLVPLMFVRDFFRETSFDLMKPETFLPAMNSGAFLQPMFNLLLMLPFGVYLSYYFKMSLGKTVLMSFLLSSFFEITQLTGIFGIYPRPYRLFDVDDLLLNTLGGFIGYGVGIWVSYLLPSRRVINAQSMRQSETVSPLRRLTAFGMDMALVAMFKSWVAFFMGIDGSVISLLIVLAYFVALQGVMGGATPGKALVRLRLVTHRPNASLWGCLLTRYALLYAPVLLIRIGFWALDYGLAGVGMLGIGLALCAYLLLTGFGQARAGQALWYERLSHTYNMSSLSRFCKTPGRASKLQMRTDP